jgi:hypothetical protein
MQPIVIYEETNVVVVPQLYRNAIALFETQKKNKIKATGKACSFIIS